MKTTILLLVIAWLGCTSLGADISQYYTFASSTGTYTSIAGTQVLAAIGNNVISGPIDIGFTFNYGPGSFTQVKLCSSGYITLGTVPGSSTADALGSSVYCPVLAPLWDNLGTQEGSVSYLLSGVAPLREFTVQYNGVNWITLGIADFDFQIKIYEDGKIEFRYGAASGAPSASNASIGINMQPGGSSNFWSITPGATPSASNTIENNQVHQWPGQGKIYTFNPVLTYPNDLTARTITGNLLPVLGIASNYTVSLRNCGTLPQTNYSVKLYAGETELASITGPAMQPNTATTVQIPWTPQFSGTWAIYGKVVLTGDENPQNDSTPPLTVNIQESQNSAVTIGNGSSNVRMPIDLYYKTSLFETIYLASEINAVGAITGVSFFNNFANNHPALPTKIWLGMTALSNLSTGWIPSTQLTQVFDGTVNYPMGQNLITIQFPTPFTYGGTNLVMMVFRPMDTQYYDLTEQFYGQVIGTNRSRKDQSLTSAINPALPSLNNSTLSGYFPKTTLYMAPLPPAPVFGVTPDAINFSPILLNETASIPVSVYNSGNGNLIINSISLSDAAMYHLQGMPALPVTLSGGQSLNFSVQYAPTAGGNHPGLLSITDNLTRVIHTIPVSGDCVDPYIYTSPYLQNFDTVTQPNLPMDWSKIVISTSTLARVVTSDYEPYTSPNYAFIGNYTDTAPTLMLISPPLAAGTNLSEKRIRFMAKGNQTQQLQVGVMADKTNPETFTLMHTISLTTAWTEYNLSLLFYNGTNRYIAFKHCGVYDDARVYIDNVIIEDMPHVELAGQSLTGMANPTVGAASVYTIGLYNWGSMPQSNYQVKLFNADNQELASLPGPILEPLVPVNFHIPWTPTIEGDTSIYGKVVLAGDENLQNNQTPSLAVSVQPAGTLVVTVGTGSELARKPLDFFYNNSLHEAIYLHSELNFYGIITGIEIYNYFPSIGLEDKPTKIWMGTTAESNLSAGWIPSTELTLVYNGNADYPINENTIEYIFRDNFLYLEGNLVVMFNRPMDTQNYSSYNKFWCQQIGNNRARTAGSDTVEYDPAAPGDVGTLSGTFAQMTFFAFPGGMGQINGTVYGLGDQPLPNAVVRVSNGSQVTSDAEGHYAFANIFSGTYSVTCTSTGYQPQTQNSIVITAGQTTSLDIYMHPVSTEDNLGMDDTALMANFPNPFNPGTTISYSLKDNDAPVSLEIYNIKGQKVSTLINTVQSKGQYNVRWDGTDDNGISVPGGIYFYKMTTGKYSATRKMILLK